MPTRVLREGILDSERVCALTFPAEVFYRRLMSAVDDFGRFDARTTVLRSRLYPLQIDKVREADIERWIAECVKSGLIALYSVSGKQYVLFPNLGAPRAKESKFPAPPPDVEASMQMYSDEYRRAHMNTDARRCIQVNTDAPYSGSGSSSSTDSGAGAGHSPPPEAEKPKKGKPGDECPLFLRFWQAYPRKVKKSYAALAFAALTPTEDLLDRMIEALKWQRASDQWSKDNGDFIPHPSTWLNARQWEDEPPSQTSGPPKRTFPGVAPEDVPFVITVRGRFNMKAVTREEAEAELRRINPNYTGAILDAA